jgi:hypothetical protein
MKKTSNEVIYIDYQNDEFATYFMSSNFLREENQDAPFALNIKNHVETFLRSAASIKYDFASEGANHDSSFFHKERQRLCSALIRTCEELQTCSDEETGWDLDIYGN